MRRVASVILGGGQGTRLFPLTLTRCKPAISFGGRYRLIDVPVSNSLNSNIDKIFIITQFLSSSLHQHVFQTYHFDSFSQGFIELLSAEVKPSQQSWYQGTADAVRQNLNYLIEAPVDYFLILSGDQLYNFDFRAMLHFAKTTDADLTLAALPIPASQAKRLGVLSIDKNYRVVDFAEKPQEEEVLKRLELPPELMEQLGSKLSNDDKWLGSMGIYLFKRKVLLDLLTQDDRVDFGKHLIPTQLKKGNVACYLYDGYWEDIGTIQSFFEANLDLARSTPKFDCYNENNRIYSSQHDLPGPKIHNTLVKDAIICEGSVIRASELDTVVLGQRTVIDEGTVVRDAIIMGNDFYEPSLHQLNHLPNRLSIGKNCKIEKAIIDKNVHIGDNVTLVNKAGHETYNGNNVYVRDGITIVTRGTHLPDNFEF
ncbi:MAG: glucose-1-phosphate adenylyltransferase [Waddliaceae bacterium]|nr:glucose-1-phosphate adenylyltransferase [Waddliaceae bacterium]